MVSNRSGRAEYYECTYTLCGKCTDTDVYLFISSFTWNTKISKTDKQNITTSYKYMHLNFSSHTSVCFHMCAQVSWCTVCPRTSFVSTVKPASCDSLGGRISSLNSQCGMARFLWHLHSRLSWVYVHYYLILSDCVLDIPEKQMLDN